MLKSTIFVGALFSLTFFASCNENMIELAPQTPSTKPVKRNKAGDTYAQKVAYTQEHLTILGKAALLLAQDAAFRTKLYSEIEKQFDGDFNATYQTLSEQNGSDNVSIGAKLNVKVQEVSANTSLSQELEAFKNVEDSLDVYPQIYIHNYEEHKQMGTFNAPFWGKNPVVIINDGEREDNFVGYTLNESGEIITVSNPVDENYADRYEVWVISLNDQLTSSRQNSNNGTASNTKLIHRDISPKFEKMIVKEHFEPWASGQSDVRARRISTFRDGVDYGQCSPTAPLLRARQNYFADLDSKQEEGTEIRKFSRKEVKNQNEITINWIYYNRWDYLDCLNGSAEFPKRGDHLFYAVFEHDCWPASKKTFSATSSVNYTVNFYCRTKESNPFASGIITSDDSKSYFVSVYSVNNGNIQFNSKL
jgi:hypothetical protein